MRLLICGDTHFGIERIGKISENEFSAFKHMIEEATARNIDYLIIAGDVYNRSKPKLHIQEKANKLYSKALSRGIGVILVPGNHDRGYIHPPLDYFFNPLYDKFQIANSIQFMKFDKFQLMLIPFAKKWPVDEIEKINIPTIIICHHTFDGAVFGPQRYTFTRKRDNAIIVENTPKDLKMVFSGHIHEAQILQHDVPIIYTGSLEPLSFAEIYDRKGFYILEDMKYEFIPYAPRTTMDVIEIDGKEKKVELLISEIQRQIQSADAQNILVRIYSRILNENEYKIIRQNFPYNIKIVPRDGHKLKKLYSKCNTNSYHKNMNLVM